MGEVSTIGLDLAKSVFQVHGADASGAVLFRRKLRRHQVLTFWHRQLNDLRQVQPLRSIRSGTRDTSHLGPDPKSLSAGTAMISGVGVGRAAEEVCNLIVSREEALRLPG
jgi:hypothetical protein